MYSYSFAWTWASKDVTEKLKIYNEGLKTKGDVKGSTYNSVHAVLYLIFKPNIPIHYAYPVELVNKNLTEAQPGSCRIRVHDYLRSFVLWAKQSNSKILVLIQVTGHIVDEEDAIQKVDFSEHRGFFYIGEDLKDHLL